MKITTKNPKIPSDKITYTVTRTPKVKMLEFKEKLTKAQANKLGELFTAYQKEKKALIDRLGQLEDVKILNSHVAGQPLGAIVPDDEVEFIKGEIEKAL